MNNLSAWQRFLADTPPFFKKVQALGILLISAAFILSQTAPVIPAKWLLALGLVGLALAVVAAFAVKDIQAIESGTPLTLESVTTIIGDMSSQINEVKNALANPPESLAEIHGLLTKLTGDSEKAAPGLPASVQQADKAPEPIAGTTTN